MSIVSGAPLPGCGVILLFSFSTYNTYGALLYSSSVLLPTEEKLYDLILIGSYSRSPSSIVEIVQRVCLIVADAIILFVTIRQTYGTVRAGQKANLQTNFASALLKAGKSIIPLVGVSSDTLCSQEYFTLRASHCLDI